MSSMSKVERVQAAVKGEAVDRVPWSIWYHFGQAFMTPDDIADIHVKYVRHYDMDFLKVMNDHYYLPPGLEWMEKADDWRRIPEIKPTDAFFGKQLQVLDRINRKLKGEMLFVDTVFSPWAAARRLVRRGDVIGEIERNPKELEAGLAAIADQIAAYAAEVINTGAAGVFYSVMADSRAIMSRENYERFSRPFDIQILQAARDAGATMNMLHNHGEDLRFDPCLDYPMDVLNWADRASGPSLEEGRKKTGVCLCGGINHTRMMSYTPADVREEALDAIAKAGKRGFILSAGCTIASETRPSAIAAVGEAALAA